MDVKKDNGDNKIAPQCSGFGINRRNYGHWDVIGDSGRLFRVRGGPGKYIVLDEREIGDRADDCTFKTVGACMGYICDQLMFELIVADGQSPNIIESWNV